MSTAFSDFGPLTERRRAERQRQQRRRFMVAAGGASVILIIIVMGGAAVAYNASFGDGSSSSSSSASSSGAGGEKPNLRGVSKIIKAMCAQTDFRDACEKSLAAANATASSSSSPKDIVRASVAVIGDAVAKAFDKSGAIVSDDPRVKAAVADCKEIYENAKDDLDRTLGGIDGGGVDGLTKRGYRLRVWLSAVIAHQETCIDGFPDGDLKDKMRGAMESGRELTSNALAIIGKASSFFAALNLPSSTPAATSHRRLLSFDEDAPTQPKVNRSSGNDDDNSVPLWVNRQERRLLKGKFENKLTPNVVVAKDGSGKFKTINDALNAMPKKYTGRYVIYVKEGVYEEYVTITKKMPNVTMYGDGAKKTIITGNRNFVDGRTTYKTATFNAQGDGFMAIAMGFRNTAGAAKHQAVALLVQSDKSIFLNCRMEGYQDTLYAHSKAQFYRNCVISGTVDFIFGDAAAVFQNCVLTLRRPLDNQKNIATAQGRADGREATGFVFQHGRITAESALKDASRPSVRSYLARPWREYSRTLIMDTDIPAFVDKAGYLPWSGEFGLKTLWYAEYGNKGDGAGTDGRVSWPGYKKVISKEEATRFTVQNFLHAEPWIKPTGTPVKYGMWN
uniref:Pectinesterase n=1 Tax=Leersia perrieri TaxID=77586 RepID=A0A0D9X8H2_9ORYZ